MAILGPEQLPVILKVDSNPLKFHALSQLGHPVVLVESVESQMEQVLRSTGNFIAHYFPLEERYAFFMTQPLQAEYPIPEDAYWIRDVSWDPSTTRIDDIFGAESFLFNIGNISGVQNILTDYHLLQSYRKFSQRILGNEGHWEFKVERGEADSDNGVGSNYGGTIKLFPVPKGSFPVVIQYLPSVNTFRSPQAQEAVYRAFLAQMKIHVGAARRKYSGIPGPDGGAITLDGGDLVTEGREEYDKAVEFAISVGEPLGFFAF
jgi:hypothetical protein